MLPGWGGRRGGSVDAFAGVDDGVDGDVGDVVVDEGVFDFATAAAPVDEPEVAQDAQVLTDLRLVQAQIVDELVDTARGVGEQHDNGDACRRGEGAQQIAGGIEGRRVGPDIGTGCGRLVTRGSLVGIQRTSGNPTYQAYRN